MYNIAIWFSFTAFFLIFFYPNLSFIPGYHISLFARFYILRDLCFACRLVFCPRFRNGWNGWVLLDRDVNYDTGSLMDQVSML